MEEYVLIFLRNIIQCTTMFYCIDKIIDKDYGYKMINKILASLGVYVVLVIISKFLFFEFLSITFINTEVNLLLQDPINDFLINISIYLFTTIILQISYFKILYNNLLKLICRIKKVKLSTVIILLSIIFNLSCIFIYNNPHFSIRMLSKIFLILAYFILLLRTFNTNIKYEEIVDKYSNNIEMLKDYEKMIDVYKVNTHENKNNLLTIRNMLGNEDNNIKDFIDNIIDNKILDDERLSMESSNIPEGGIRATIYSKLLEMKSKKIRFDLEADFKVRRYNLDNVNILAVCNILGVFLDNAIYESLILKEKGYIKVTLLIKKKKLYISIKNKYDGLIDLEKIEEPGYTTKGNGHGYGLVLVNNIICENSNLENIKKITKTNFEQTLIIN